MTRIRVSRRLRVEPLEDRTVPASLDPATGIGYSDDGKEFIALMELPDPVRLAESEAHGNTGASVLSPPDVFQLHSRPGASKLIFLDFDGNTTTGTSWNNASLPAIYTPTYDVDGDPSSFSTAERQRIQGIWERVSEDYSPFDIDVTTEDPGAGGFINSGGGDTHWGIHVCIGGDSSWLGASAGGVAFIGSFGSNTDICCFVFENNLANGDEKATAEAASHEVGHTVGLNHDGLYPSSDPRHVEYYEGQGSGTTGWAPIMGVGYYQNLTQWSKGEYANSSNKEDDLNIITTQNGFGYRPDDHGNTVGTADPVTLDSTTSISGDGVIERRGDFDYFKVQAGVGPLAIHVRPFANSPNLDVLAELYDANGTKVASANPTDAFDATINYNVTHAGDFYLKIDGTGKGSPVTTGYSDYASLGQYTFTGTIVEPPPPDPLQVLGVETLQGPTGMVNAVRLTFNVTPDLTTFKFGNLRVTGPTGAAIPVTMIRPLTGSTTVYDLLIKPQKFIGTGGVRVYLSPNVSTGFKKLDQDNDGIDGEVDDFLGAAAYPFESTSAGPITDDGVPTEFPITVPALVAGQPVNIKDVNVRVNLSHPYVSDLLVELVSPTNKVVKLFDHRGADGNDLKDTRFDDLATKTIDAAVAPFVGTFKPDGGSLAMLNGDDAVGIWKLRITDAFAGAAGQLNSWGLTLTTDSARSGLHLTAINPVSETGSAVATLVSGLTLDFDAPVNPATMTTADVKVTDPRLKAVRVLSVVPAAGMGNMRFLVATAPWTVAGNYTVKVGPAVADMLGDDLDTNGNAAYLEVTDATMTAVPVANHVFRSKAKPTAIPDGGSLTSAIAVGATATIASMAIELNIQHSAVGDLKVTLISPTGAQFVLIDHSGTGANFVRTVLSDEASATNTLATGAAPYRGDFRPDNSLAGLVGTSAKGTWKLRVEDTVTGADL
ncbi:MAG TPA: proprotein convertase P-domain-containing protein, partial [Gemmataceae bacterium]|nr:proprotein convertase P-domain-containing protein [Gemmataceae bacterium]